MRNFCLKSALLFDCSILMCFEFLRFLHINIWCFIFIFFYTLQLCCVVNIVSVCMFFWPCFSISFNGIDDFQFDVCVCVCMSAAFCCSLFVAMFPLCSGVQFRHKNIASIIFKESRTMLPRCLSRPISPHNSKHQQQSHTIIKIQNLTRSPFVKITKGFYSRAYGSNVKIWIQRAHALHGERKMPI